MQPHAGGLHKATCTQAAGDAGRPCAFRLILAQCRPCDSESVAPVVGAILAMLGPEWPKNVDADQDLETQNDEDADATEVLSPARQGLWDIVQQ